MRQEAAPEATTSFIFCFSEPTEPVDEDQRVTGGQMETANKEGETTIIVQEKGK